MKGKLSCDFQFLPFAARLRRPPGQDSEHKDISSRLAQTFESVICLDRFPKAQVDVCVNVLQDDGSAFAAAVTCASAALANAGVQMFDIVTGCSAVSNMFTLFYSTLHLEIDVDRKYKMIKYYLIQR
jgi:exosome complex component MTR3